MADLTITVSNSLNVFGGSPSTKWGVGSIYTMTWGSSKWGEGTEKLQFEVEKLLTNSIASDTTLSFDSVKLVENSIASTFEMSSETLTDNAGYYYVFVRPSTDAEEQVFTSYSSGSAASTTWTSATAASTDWSE